MRVYVSLQTGTVVRLDAPSLLPNLLSPLSPEIRSIRSVEPHGGADPLQVCIHVASGLNARTWSTPHPLLGSESRSGMKPPRDAEQDQTPSLNGYNFCAFTASIYSLSSVVMPFHRIQTSPHTHPLQVSGSPLQRPSRPSITNVRLSSATMLLRITQAEVPGTNMC